MEERKADPRFNEFEEQFNGEGVAIGFRLPGNPFLFQYDETSGWCDEKGRYYSKDGVLMDQEQAQEESQDSEEDSQIDDDQIVDEFQQMLIEQQQGIIRPKNQKRKQVPPQTVQKQLNYDQQTKKYVQKLKNKEQIRQGISPLICIFFKIKQNFYEQIKAEVQKEQTLNGKNQIIKKIKAQIQSKRNQLLQNNKWLNGQFSLQYSGSSPNESIYDRYWYGWIKVSHQNYQEKVEQIKKSKQFATLKSKTFYALKSKFYLKSKMKQTIDKLRSNLTEVKQDGAIIVNINNLPDQFPLSFVIDLIELSGGFLQDVEDINIIDESSADLVVKKRTAEIITNIEGYCHQQKQYIWIEMKDLARPIKFSQWFNVEVDADYKVPIREVSDTLALLNARQECVKFYGSDQVYRLVVNQNVIKKVLMFRGETLNAARIIRFEKKAE